MWQVLFVIFIILVCSPNNLDMSIYLSWFYKESSWPHHPAPRLPGLYPTLGTRVSPRDSGHGFTLLLPFFPGWDTCVLGKVPSSSWWFLTSDLGLPIAARVTFLLRTELKFRMSTQSGWRCFCCPWKFCGEKSVWWDVGGLAQADTVMDTPWLWLIPYFKTCLYYRDEKCSL